MNPPVPTPAGRRDAWAEERKQIYQATSCLPNGKKKQKVNKRAQREDEHRLALVCKRPIMGGQIEITRCHNLKAVA